MFRNVYCVPFHREIPIENLKDYFEETNYAKEVYGLDCPILFFEDKNIPINKINIENMKSKYDKVKVYYISRKNVIDIYDRISSYLSNSARSIFQYLYPNENVNYGNVLNKIFIFATLFGAEYIHRRDSDIQIDLDKKQIKIFPIKSEIECNGKVIKDKTVYITGGSYKGDLDLDIESLMEDGNSALIKKLYQCMSMPDGYCDDIFQEEENSENYSEQIEFCSGQCPECGNVGIYKLHHYLPASCQDYVLGTDYFFIDIAIEGKLNVAFHNRKVIHKHTLDRKKEYQKLFHYWKGFMMLIDTQAYYRKLYNECFSSKTMNEKELESEVEVLTSNMKKNYQYFSEYMFEKRLKNLEESQDILLCSSDSILQDIVKKQKELNMNKYVMQYTNESIGRHIELMENWKEIIHTCIKIRDDKELFCEIKKM